MQHQRWSLVAIKKLAAIAVLYATTLPAVAALELHRISCCVLIQNVKIASLFDQNNSMYLKVTVKIHVQSMNLRCHWSDLHQTARGYHVGQWWEAYVSIDWVGSRHKYHRCLIRETSTLGLWFLAYVFI